MVRYFLILLSLAFLGTPAVLLAGDANEDVAKAEVKKLQGTWQVTKWVGDSGEAVGADEIKDFTFVFKGETVDMRNGKDSKRPMFKFSLNPTKKPKWLDIEMGGPIGTTEGIYKLEDDLLTLCLVSGGKDDKPAPRPTDFAVKKGEFHALFVLKRVKE
jgi:uncharacterized protein (TIGR03067 family)